MSIFPLPVFEADADPHHRTAMTDTEIYERLEIPKTLVVKFGMMKLVAELPYGGDIKPGCGTKLVARTMRGTEIVEMLTTTCENAGCSKSITRKEMLEYIENSGGRDYPFHTKGKILRVASIEDLNRQSELEATKREWVKTAKAAIAESKLKMKLVEIEPILGQEVLTLYYMAEDRIDFRDLVKKLAAEFGARIEMRQVGARDEARLVADYERCGQHCCCKNFLKVLKPVSMRAAKMQKATLDPLKISGRCGRLMCCLRYEDASYRELKANLPHRKTRVGTNEGPGIVLDSKILAQLVLIRLESDDREIAVPVEELMDPDECPTPAEVAARKVAAAAQEDPLRGMPAEAIGKPTEDDAKRKRGGRRRRRGKSKTDQQAAHREKVQQTAGTPPKEEAKAGSDGPATKKSRKKRRGRRGGGSKPAGSSGGTTAGGGATGSEGAAGGKSSSTQKGGGRRRRRKRGRGGRGGGADGGGAPKPGGS